MQDLAPSVEALVRSLLLSRKAAIQAPLLSMWEPFEVVNQEQAELPVPLWTGCQSLKLCFTDCSYSYKCSVLE